MVKIDITVSLCYIFLMVMETRSKSFQAAEVMYHKLVFIHDPQDLGGKKA